MSDEAIILMIEDNPGDVRLVEEGFNDGQITNTLYAVHDGQEALDFLHQKDDYEDAPQPDLILLDLNLPRMDGEDVLHEIKTTDEFKDISVIVLTGMDEELAKSRDIDHDTDPDGYLEKPVDVDEILKMARKFDQFCVSLTLKR